MSDSLEDDWETLGQPGRIERNTKRAGRWFMTFLEFIFTWIGHAWDKVCATLLGIWTRLWNTEFLSVVALSMCFLGIFWTLGKLIWADGRIDYCWIDQTQEATPATKEKPAEPDQFTLKGHRDWREDRNRMYVSEHKEDVLAWAKALGCPLR